MPTVTLYHNPRCSKSREALALLEERGIEPKIIEYLKTPLSVEELKTVIALLKIQPEALLRKKEAVYKELDLNNPNTTDEQRIEAMANHPSLIERPIVITGNKAAIGRPPENILEIL